MSTQINDGGSAFPFGQVSESTGQPINGFFNPGMSLRDLFAGQALMGQLASMSTAAAVAGIRAENAFEVCSKSAFAFADAMIAAREVKP